MKSLAKQYSDTLARSERCKRYRSDRKRVLQDQLQNLMLRCLKEYVRKTPKRRDDKRKMAS